MNLTRLSAAVRSNLPIVAVWATDDTDGEPLTVQVFRPSEYAHWSETNHLYDAYPFPTRFYGTTDDSSLVELKHTVETNPYDETDDAIVVHTWSIPTTGELYTAGVSQPQRSRLTNPRSPH